MKLNYALLAAGLALFGLSPVYAASTSSASQKLSQQDKTWIKKAHQINLAEITLGHMAEKKGQSSSVRSAGKTIATDHKNLDQNLKPVARKNSVQLSSSPSSKQQAKARKLSRKSGAKFDRAWTKKLIAGHKKAIRKTRKEIAKGSSVAVKTLASSALPLLEKHLRIVQAAKKKMSTGSH